MQNDIVLGYDGRRMELTIWSRQNAVKTLLVAPAIGVSRKFYSSISKYFFDNGFNVVSFDYATVLEGDDYLAAWGSEDIAKAIEYAGKLFPGQALYFLGHSMAGQLLPLASNNHKLDATILIASQNVALDYWTGSQRVKLMFYWRVVLPLVVRLKGYLPGYVYGGSDLTSSIAKDWRRWALSADGILSAVRSAATAYRNFSTPVMFISFRGDFFASERSVNRLVTSYGSYTKLHRHYRRDELGITGNIHFNFFRSKYAHNWPLLMDWFNQLKTGSQSMRTAG